MGIDHNSEALVEGSKSIASEANASSPNSFVSTSLVSPLPDHSPQQPSGLVEMQPIIKDYDYEQASKYLVYNRSVTSSEASMEEHAESQNQQVSSEGSEYIYDGSFDGMIDTFFYNNNNNSSTVTEAWPAGVGGLSLTFGIQPLANNTHYEYPTERFMAHCHLCGNCLYKEQKDIFIFKGEYAFCSEKCREVEVGYDDFKEKAARKDQKESDAKRSENIEKFPVVFELGSSD